MGYNFLNYDGKIITSAKCIHDSNIGYEADFTINGEVDGWTYYDGIHTYGCWNNFLFGTLYGEYAVVGRHSVFRAVEAEHFYTVKIVMKLNMLERVGTQVVPTKGRLMWRTLSNPVWAPSMQYDFDIFNDTEWHTYLINLADAQWWQGDVNDLRIYPILENGRDGDEFYIRTIEIISVDTYKCLNANCDYYTRYEHTCPGIGERGYCKSYPLSAYVLGGTTHEFAETKFYTVEKDVNDLLLININDYGYENIVLEPFQNYSGDRVARLLAREISKLAVGGYAECDVEYTEKGEFIIYSGVYADDSTVLVGDTTLAKDFNFRNIAGEDISTKYIGSNPASGFSPYSSFKIKTHQIYSLLDDKEQTEFYFNPFIYNVEGGRRDWLTTGLGDTIKDVRDGEIDVDGTLNRTYEVISNVGQTVIDFTHPFNASGRITKVYAGVTLDNFSSGDWEEHGAGDVNRKATQLSGAKIMFFRPLKNGNLKVLPFEIDINDRNHDLGKLYSSIQEFVELDCDFFINKGDLIGVYNANVYISKSVSGKEVDALYYQILGKATGIVDVRQPLGNGSAGLLIYARSNQIQNRLALEIDLGQRTNVKDIEVIGSSDEDILEYNIARCLDVDWQVDLFEGDHTTGYVAQYRPLVKHYYNHPNIYYGKECLNDGVKVVTDGLAAESFSVETDTYYRSHASAIHKKDGGSGVILNDPKYFSINGDCEWLGVYLHQGHQSPFITGDFEKDPIAFTLFFPLDKDKLIYKSKIYFKERYNFRSFGFSIYKGDYYVNGNADDTRFDYIPYRTDGTDTPWTKINLDGIEYTPENTMYWSDLNLYLAHNPCEGGLFYKTTRVIEYDYDEYMAYYDELGGLNYMGAGEIVNNEQYTQATKIDWMTITHEWEPVSTKGFRIYCTNHKSTKICEMELYCLVENIKSTMGGSVDITYSDYGDYWWVTANSETKRGTYSFIGDTPRYINIIITPITEINLSDIVINISYEDVFMGSKGCQHTFLPDSVKRGGETSPQIVYFKNTYGKSYDLYVDIASDELTDDGVVFFSLMNDEASINNPIIGADAYYKKHEDYHLLNYQKNVAINCPVYALNNLLAGKDAWYSYDGEYSWKYWGKIVDGKNINFPNLPNVAITTINLPVLKRSQWWKLGFYDPRIVMNVREIQLYYDGEEITNVQFYHQKDKDAILTANEDTAPHLKNNIVDGSYYILTGNSYIGFKLPAVQSIDKIVIYHDYLLEYENSHDKAGIDSSTALCIHGAGYTYQTDSIIDVSYYEHNIAVVGSGIYCDKEFEEVYYEFTQDFSDCENVIDTFDTLDLSMWTDLVNASVTDSKLNITNSGIIGQAVTVPYYYGDFDIKVDLDITDAYESLGWGCYLVASNDEGKLVRVGRTYSYYAYSTFISQEFGDSGWVDISHKATTDYTNLKLRLLRIGTSTTCYVQDTVTGDWYSLQSSNVLESSPVRFSLISDLTPLAVGVTTAKFDNFEGEKLNSDWGVNTDNNSSFTCVSGTGPNGYAYYYDIGVATDSDASGYKIPKIFDYQSYPLDQDFVFTFEFTFQAEAFFDQSGTSSNLFGVSVGILGRKVALPTGYSRPQSYFTGVQVVLTRDTIGIGIRNDWCDGEDTYVSLDTTAVTYYCRFTGDGAGNYHCYVWTDEFDGSNIVADFSLNSDLTWEAYKVGVGASHGSASYIGRCTGWVSDFNFYCDKVSENHKIHDGSIKFNGFQNEKLLITYDNNPQCNIVKEGFNFDSKRFTIDFFIKFNSLPNTVGDKIYLFKCWDDEQPIEDGVIITIPSSWVFTLENVDNNYSWCLYFNVNNVCRKVMGWDFYPDLQRWYHFYLCRGPLNDSDTKYVTLLRNGHIVYNSANTYSSGTIIESELDLVIGENLDGWMEEIRVSSDYTLGGGRISSSAYYYKELAKSVPTNQYERYYTVTVYDSVDNINYGIQMYTDVLFDNSYSYHEPFSLWSETYYTYFAIDFEQRHDIEIVRSYPIDTAYEFSLDTNVLYSNKETSDPAIAFSLTEEEQNLNNTFTGMDHDYPDNWTKLDTNLANSYIVSDKFYQMCSPTAGQEYARARSNFYFDGNFDFYVDYDLGNTYAQNNSWEVSIQIDDVDNENNKIKFERCYKDGTNQYVLRVKDDSSSWTTAMATWRNQARATLRIARDKNIFKVYVKSITDSFEKFELLGSYQIRNSFSSTIQLNLYTLSDTTAYPFIENWWDNFVVVEANPIYSTSQDARWIRVKMLNGDGITRTIENAGIYSDVSTQHNKVGQYNNYWTSLGTAITSYSVAENIALGATISGSSYVGIMTFENAVNGIVSNTDLDKCWGANDTEENPYIIVYFSQEEPIFRFKIYHGYNIYDVNNIITDYKIQVSTDNETFTTVFDITDNSEYIRIHDLSAPVYATAVRLYVENYIATDKFIWKNQEEGYQFWAGALLREFEIYKYYGFTVVNSEDTPIIAIDLQQPYFVEGHSLIGIDSENTEIDWDNDDSNFAWSNSHLSNPHKVVFGEWGQEPGYAKWVVVKRNTATHYPTVPTSTYIYTDTPDYLKHVLIHASTDEEGSAPNPLEYPWMWRANVSELSYDYDIVTNGVSVDRSLKIEYPASTQPEHVRFIEGDHFGWDSVASWRDGFGFFLYIDDVTNLDLEYGYFYLGGYDYTAQEYPVTYRWNMTTFSGILKNGWNNLNLTFLYADDVVYTELVDDTGRDPRRLYSIKWSSVGFVFKGKGAPLQLNFEGLYIERNHFEHGCFPGQQGLYLHANDMMKLPIGELDFHSGALEFWIRPDWNWDGRDIYSDFKFRTLFHFGNVANDVFGAAISSRGIEIYFGNLLEDFNLFIISEFDFSAIEKIFHMAFVFSNDGTGIGPDGSTIRVYINNGLIAKSTSKWKVSDSKHFNFVLGGQGLLVQKTQGFDPASSAVDGVICRLKIHNYCKIDYSDSLYTVSDECQRTLYKPSNFIEISNDNVTYHRVGSTDLPFFFEDVAPGESIPIWVKVRLPKDLTGAEKRTSKILGSWDIGV